MAKLATHVRRAIKQLDLGQVDDGAQALAIEYAKALDADQCPECGEKRTIGALGPKLLAALHALGATPAARSSKGGGDDGPSPLDELRKRRDERERDPSAVDPTAT